MHQVSGSPSACRKFLEWQEQFVSHDRGSRVVHYYLKDDKGISSLAVVGTERSLRHMVYVVSDEFLPLAGLDKSSTATFKWRARREVVDWLTSLIAKSRSSATINDLHLSGSPKHYQSPLSESDEVPHVKDIEGWEILDQDRGHCQKHIQKNHYAIENGEVVWVGASWSCRKRLRHYNSFQRNGITISVQDFVYVMSEEKERHIGYIEDMYEDKKSRKKLRIRWFHKKNELFCKIPPPAPQLREVFYTPFPQVLSVECVDGLATVLTPEHFEKCSTTLPPEVMADIHICSRQFDGECIKLFNICNVKGYWHQQVLKVLDMSLPLKASPTYELGSDYMEVDEDEEIDPGNIVKRGPRTVRYCRRRARKTDSSSVHTAADVASASANDQLCLSAHHDTEVLYGQRLDGSCSLAFGPEIKKSVQQADHRLMMFEVGDKIEVLSEDSGIRGCWFKGTVLRRVSHRVKIRYDDLLNEDSNGNLEEWVSAWKVAALDKLGMRIAGRVTLRPCPTKIEPPLISEVGLAVDAWWHDGWWEGVVLKLLPGDKVEVYFPGESDIYCFQQEDLRISKDWVNGQWVDVKRKPEALSMIDGFLAGNMDSIVERSHPGQTPTLRPSTSAVDLKDCLVEGHLEQAMEEKSSAAESSLAGDCVSNTFVLGNKVSPSDVKALQRLEILTNVASCMEQSGSIKLPEADVQDNCLEIQTEASQQSLHKGCGIEDCMCVRCVEDRNKTNLKWKSGRKRQRQADPSSARVEKSGSHFLKDQAKDSSAESIPEENVSLQGNSNETKWQIVQENIEKSDNDLVKIVRNHEGTNPIHGPTVGTNILLNSLPAASLVMSR